MFEGRQYAEVPPSWNDPPELDVDALLARDPSLRRHFEDDSNEPDPVLDPAWEAYLNDQPPKTARIYLEEDRPLRQRDPESLTDAEAISRLIEVEAGIAGSHALRARLVALVAAQRPGTSDRPDGRPGAAAKPVPADPVLADPVPDVVADVMPVSEWLSHELQMAHPYSRHAALDLVETSLVLNGRLTSTLGLLAAGQIDYHRARILADLLGTCSEPVAHTVEAIVLPKAPGLTPSGLAAAIRRALARIDAAALRRRHARARRAAVGYYPTEDGWPGWSPTSHSRSPQRAVLRSPATPTLNDPVGMTGRSERSAPKSSPT